MLIFCFQKQCIIFPISTVLPSSSTLRSQHQDVWAKNSHGENIETKTFIIAKKIISDSFECYFCFVLIMILTFTSSVLNKINWGIYYTSTGNAHLICPKPVCLQNETVSCEVVSKIIFSGCTFGCTYNIFFRSVLLDYSIYYLYT
jgi:hypothetical protein